MPERPDLRIATPPAWEPGKREEYAYYRKPASPETREQADRELVESVRRYWDQYLRNPQGGLALLGAKLGKAFIRSCQVQGEVANSEPQAPQKALEAIKRSLNLGHVDLVGELTNGFLAEYALAQGLVSQRAYEVYLPNDRLGDTYEEGKGVDLWVNLANGVDDREPEDGYIGMPVQVKCATLRKDFSHLVYPLTSERDLRYLVEEVFTPLNVYGNYDFEKAQASFRNLYEYGKSFRDAIPAVALFNTPGQDADRDMPHISKVTGKLHPELLTKVLGDIEGIKGEYLDRSLQRAA